MIGEPVALTIRRNIERPAAALLKAFRGAPSGFVTDAYNGQGCLDHGIKPIEAAMKICGPALTCFCSPTDNLAAMAVLDFARKGDIAKPKASITRSTCCGNAPSSSSNPASRK